MQQRDKRPAAPVRSTQPPRVQEPHTGRTAGAGRYAVDDIAPGASDVQREAFSQAVGRVQMLIAAASGPVQRREGGPAARDPAAVQAAAQAGVRGGGGALPHHERIQAAFGAHDVSHVRAHTGGDAAAASDAMGARAYATGDAVAFKEAPDLHTAAHEAAHVVQQRAGVALAGGVGQAGDRYEQEADQVADAVVAGRSAEGLLGPARGGGARAAVQRVVQKDDDENASYDPPAMTPSDDGGQSSSPAPAEPSNDGGVGPTVDNASNGTCQAPDNADGQATADGAAQEPKKADDEKATPPAEARASVVGMSNKFVIPIGDEKTLAHGAWGEASVSGSCEVSYKMVSDPTAGRGDTTGSVGTMGPDSPAGPKKDEASAGALNDSQGNVGIVVEGKREIGDALGGTARIKAGGEGQVDIAGRSKGKVGVGGEIEWKLGAMPITGGFEFNLIEWDKTGGKTGAPKIGVINITLDAKLFTFSHTFASGLLAGASAQVEVTTKGELKVNPNELWLAEQLITKAAPVLASPAAFVVGGLLSIGLPLYAIIGEGDITAEVDALLPSSLQQMRTFGREFLATAKGQGSNAKALEWRREMEKTATPQEVDAYIAKLGDAAIYDQAARQAWPSIKEKAVASYYERHKVGKYASKVLGDTPGVQALRRTLNAYDVEASRLD